MPIFPSDWPSATTDVASLVLEHQAVTKTVRLTPAQRRNAIYTAVIEAIIEGDCDAVKRITAANPTVSFDEPGCESVCSALFGNFTPEIFDFLYSKDLPINPSMYATLTENFSQQLYERFVKNAQTDTHYTYDAAAETIFNQALKNMLHPSNKVRVSSRLLRTAMLQDFPQLVAQIVKPFYSTNCWQVDLLNKLPLFYPENFHPEDQLFIEQLHPDIKAMCIRGIAARFDDVTLSQLNSINRFFANHPSYAMLFDQQQTTAALEKTQNLSVLRSIIPVGAHTWSDTDMVSYLQSVQNQWRDDEVLVTTGHHHFTFGRDVDHHLHRSNMFCTTPELDQKLGFDVYDRLYVFYIHTKITIAGYVDGHRNIKHQINQGDDDFFTKMIICGAPAATALLKTPQMLERVNTLLHTKHYMMKWVTKAPITAIQQLCKAYPHWKTWTDENGNNLAHYLCALRSTMHCDQKVIGHLTRINPHWLIQPNNNGVNISQIVNTRFSSASLKAWVEQQTLNAELKSVPSTKQKMSSRSQSTRKM